MQAPVRAGGIRSQHPFRRSLTTRRSLLTAGLGLGAVGALAGCGVTRGESDDDLLMMIPNSPGGGYDLTGRAAVAAMEANDITGGEFTVDNVIGAGGSVALTALMGKTGNTRTLMTLGLGVVGSLYSFGSDYRLQDATPIAQLMSEPEAVVVPADSPFKTIDDAVQAWTDDPGGISVGGGSSPGGPDHLFPMQLASTVGIDPREVNYITYDGGGPLATALLGAKIQLGCSGPGELLSNVESGELRVLGLSGEEASPVDVLADVPTLRDAGIDLTFLNWRGVIAPPDLDADRRDEFIGFMEQMHETEQWQETLATNGWTDDFITGEEFADFLQEQDSRVSSTLTELELL